MKTTIQFSTKEWRYARLGDVTTGSPSYGANAPSIPYKGGVTARYVRITDISEEGCLIDESKVGIDPRFENGNILEDGDIVIARTGASVGKSLLFRSQKERAAFAGYLIRFQPDSRICEGGFLRQCLHSDRYWAWVRKMIRAGAQPNINSKEFASYEILLPGLAEQRKIASILESYDRAFETIRKLINAKKKRLSALRERLIFEPRKSLKERSEIWTKVTLSDVADDRTDRNDGKLQSSDLYAVTKSAGLVPMRERVKGDDHSRCKLVYAGCFAYNPMRLNIGSIACWKGNRPVMVSGDYVVFRCKPDKILVDYVEHIRQTPAWKNFVSRAGNGSVRIRIYFEELGKFPLVLPSLKKQKEISSLLNSFSLEIQLLEKLLSALKEQKQGLMQKLLTGVISIKP